MTVTTTTDEPPQHNWHDDDLWQTVEAARTSSYDHGHVYASGVRGEMRSVS